MLVAVVIALVGSAATFDIEVNAQTSDRELTANSVNIEPISVENNPKAIHLYTRDAGIPAISAYINIVNYSESRRVEINTSLFRKGELISNESNSRQISNQMVEDSDITLAPVRFGYQPGELGNYRLEIKAKSDTVTREIDIPVIIEDRTEVSIDSEITVDDFSLESESETLGQGESINANFSANYTVDETSRYVKTSQGLNMGETEILINGEVVEEFDGVGNIEITHESLREKDYAEEGEWMIQQSLEGQQEKIRFNVRDLNSNPIKMLLDRMLNLF